MPKIAKCQAKGGVAACKNPRCPEKVAGSATTFDAVVKEKSSRSRKGVKSGQPDPQVFAAWLAETKAQEAATLPVDEVVYDQPLSRYDNNPVRSPKRFGVELVGTASLPTPPGDYGYYQVAVVKKADGYYVSTDSGCSCPTPWESHSMAEFTGPLTASQVSEEIQSLHDTTDEKYQDGYSRGEIAGLQRLVGGGAGDDHDAFADW